MIYQNPLYETISILKNIRINIRAGSETSVIDELDTAIEQLERLVEDDDCVKEKALIVVSKALDKLPVIAAIIELFKK